MLVIELFRQKLPNLKKVTSTEWSCQCPFHEEKTPSFYVNEITGQYYCFGCGESGNHHVFIKKFGIQVDEQEIVRDEIIKSTISGLTGSISPIVISQLHRNLLLDSKRIEYLIRERFISYFSIKKYLIGYDPDTSRYAIPIRSKSGKFVNIKLHDSQKKPKSISWKTGFGSARLYPIDALYRNQVILCEGEFDTLALQSRHINAVTSTTGAESWQSEWCELFTDKEVIVAFDNDEAGHQGSETVKTSLKSIAKNVKIITWQTTIEGYDITNFIRDGGDVFKLLGIERRL